jgi:hypothetical protein
MHATMCVMRDLFVKFAFIAIAAGCATTKPWQREILAKPVMSVETSDPLDTLHAHVRDVREGSTGGLDGGGGGCGCN